MCTTFPEFPGVDWAFNRNMIIVREGDDLTLINTVRLGDDGLSELDQLGTVVNVVRIGALHDRDDPFYIDRYSPTFWTLPGIEPSHQVDRRLTPDGPTPFSECTIFAFETTQFPEGVLVIERDGGIAVGCDALQNWLEPDEHFNPETVELMTSAGFFQPTNFGPLFMMRSQPDKADFDRLLALPFKHALCGHGEPVFETAHEAYTARAEQTFGG
jgi:hypothetical protein